MTDSKARYEPIAPKPGRRWPPEHWYMDEDGNWWEAAGVRAQFDSLHRPELRHYNRIVGNVASGNAQSGFYIGASYPEQREKQ